MDKHTATEQAYKRCYEDGKQDAMKWIPVSEPPEENGYYLCYVLTSAVGDKVKYEQMPLYWEDDIWLYRNNSYRMCRNVTHWMPLPSTEGLK